MSQHLSSSKEVNTSGWDRAIADAKEILDRVEQRAARLRSTIQTFKESKAAGEKWSATQLPDHFQEQQHSV